MKYSSQYKPLTLDLFRSSFEDLNKTNRWVILGDNLPWGEIEKEYNSRLDNKYKGAGNKPARMIIGAMIIKHKLNREYLKDEEIKSFCKPLGRPSKESKTPEFIAKMTKAVGERNEIECSFGTGKRIYRANNIRAKLPDTSECWVGMCYFVKNVMKFLRGLCLVLFEILLKIRFYGNLERKVCCAPSYA